MRLAQEEGRWALAPQHRAALQPSSVDMRVRVPKCGHAGLAPCKACPRASQQCAMTASPAPAALIRQLLDTVQVRPAAKHVDVDVLAGALMVLLQAVQQLRVALGPQHCGTPTDGMTCWHASATNGSTTTDQMTCGRASAMTGEQVWRASLDSWRRAWHRQQAGLLGRRAVTMARQPVTMARQPVTMARQPPVTMARQPVTMARQPVAMARQPEDGMRVARGNATRGHPCRHTHDSARVQRPMRPYRCQWSRCPRPTRRAARPALTRNAPTPPPLPHPCQ
eukprot:352031-Chlamydomonas_euryale.AAC.1